MPQCEWDPLSPTELATVAAVHDVLDSADRVPADLLVATLRDGMQQQATAGQIAEGLREAMAWRDANGADRVLQQVAGDPQQMRARLAFESALQTGPVGMDRDGRVRRPNPHTRAGRRTR